MAGLVMNDGERKCGFDGCRCKEQHAMARGMVVLVATAECSGGASNDWCLVVNSKDE